MYYLLWGIGDIVEHYPWVVQFILNCSISTWPLGPPLSRAKVNVTIDLLLLNIRHAREDVAVTVSISWINVADPLINVAQWSQMLVPLLEHPIVSSGVKMWMCLGVPQVV